MSDEWFREWVKHHCAATAGPTAGADVAGILYANREIILDAPWSATEGELREITARLVRERRVPRFPNEHTDAVGEELVKLREERRAAALPAPITPPVDAAPSCPACGGSGLATIPMKDCLPGLLDAVLGRRPWPTKVPTGAVLCDRVTCLAGERVCMAERAKLKPPREGYRPRLSQCERTAGYHDLPGLLRDCEHEAAVVARCSGPVGTREERLLAPNLERVIAAARRKAAA